VGSLNLRVLPSVYVMDKNQKAKKERSELGYSCNFQICQRPFCRRENRESFIRRGGNGEGEAHGGGHAKKWNDGLRRRTASDSARGERGWGGVKAEGECKRVDSIVEEGKNWVGEP